MTDIALLREDGYLIAGWKSGSPLDRAVAVACKAARELGLRHVVISSGDTGSADTEYETLYEEKDGVVLTDIRRN